MSIDFSHKEHSVDQEREGGKRLHWSASRTRRLFHQYRQTGDRAVRDEIFSYYDNLVSFLAKQYAGRGIDYDDLYQEGCIGLLMAIERYDLSRGVKFSTFAPYYIRGRIFQYFLYKAWPCYVPKRYKEMSLRIRNLADRLGYEPSKQEVMELLGIQEDDADAALAATKVWESVCLYKTDFANEFNPAVLHYVSCEDRDLELTPERISLQDAAARKLSSEELTIFYLRYYEQMSQAEIAQMLGTYQMMVSRILHKATDKLVKIMREEET